MMKSLFPLHFFFCCYFYFAQTVIGAPRVIYGEDNRQEAHSFTDPLFRHYARSTAAMIRKSRLPYSQESKTHRLRYRPLQAGYCAEERFYGQPIAASCSGFLVAADLLVTAGHCVSSIEDCKRSYWVFNFELNSNGDFKKELLPQDIYSCVEVVESVDERSRGPLERKLGVGDDYSLLRLDRAVEGRDPLPFRQKGRPQIGDSLVVIGHSQGLPKKIADGAQVKRNSSPYYFVADLDTYSGGSGSPVFNEQTAMVEGFLVRGGQDYKKKAEELCFISNVCGEGECRGEDINRITSIRYLKSLPE